MNLYISFLWHFHQPFYYDVEEKLLHLPWVRLHALRSYYSLGKYIEKYPTIRMNFNFTSSLIEQLNYYRDGIYDYLYILNKKDIKNLSQKEKLYTIRNSFYGHYPTTIKPYSRYRELYIKYIKNNFSDESLLRAFREQDILDLIVLSNLSWFSNFEKSKDEFLKYLIKKKRNFSEYEKRSLLEKELITINKILPLYKKLQKKGKIELTTTPYSHPIMPLLADNYSAKVSLPGLALPQERFAYPEDLHVQIKKSVKTYYYAFDSFPKGMWPSEGAVGDFILPFFWQNGIKWIATDSEILGMTKKIFLTNDEYGVTNNPEILYKLYILKKSIPSFFIVFRDHFLSDLFGFVYSGMKKEDSMRDFVFRLKRIKEKLKDKEGDYLVTIVLDGENPWEYYEKAGCDVFFEYLLYTLSELTFIKTTKISDFINSTDSKEFLTNLYIGSWINHNLRTWIGDDEKNLAWDYLNFVRNDFKKLRLKENKEQIESAYKSLLFAEGSDWFWWYGEGHQTAEEDKLDYLFRKHLKNIYSLLNKKAPQFLEKPIIKIEDTHIPKKKFTPNINGIEDSKEEWIYAGKYEIESGTMSNANIYLPFHAFYYGNDDVNLYIRLDLKEDCCNNIIIIINDISYAYNLLERKGDTVFAYNKILEIAIPLEKKDENSIKMKIIFKNGKEEYFFPYDYYMFIQIK